MKVLFINSLPLFLQQEYTPLRFIGNVGIESSHIHVKKTTAGTLADRVIHQLDVFEKRAGRWQHVAEQMKHETVSIP